MCLGYLKDPAQNSVLGVFDLRYTEKVIYLAVFATSEMIGNVGEKQL